VVPRLRLAQHRPGGLIIVGLNALTLALAAGGFMICWAVVLRMRRRAALGAG